MELILKRTARGRECKKKENVYSMKEAAIYFERAVRKLKVSAVPRVSKAGLRGKLLFFEERHTVDG